MNDALFGNQKVGISGGRSDLRGDPDSGVWRPPPAGPDEADVLKGGEVQTKLSRVSTFRQGICVLYICNITLSSSWDGGWGGSWGSEKTLLTNYVLISPGSTSRPPLILVGSVVPLDASTVKHRGPIIGTSGSSAEALSVIPNDISVRSSVFTRFSECCKPDSKALYALLHFFFHAFALPEVLKDFHFLSLTKSQLSLHDFLSLQVFSVLIFLFPLSLFHVLKNKML